jgi:hypothetical protein
LTVWFFRFHEEAIGRTSPFRRKAARLKAVFVAVPWQAGKRILNEKVTAAHLKGWTPIAFCNGPKGTEVQWIDLGDADFSEPFFFETVERRLGQPCAPVATSDLQALGELPALSPCLRPSFFLYHASRCGSTLLANVLKVPERHLVLSEPNPLNQLLSSPLRRGAPQLWQQLFQATVICLGQPRRGAQARYITKFSSHAILRATAISAAFPDVPWLFLYRHPLEILVSALQSPPGWLRLFERPEKAAELIEMDPRELASLSLEAYAIEVLHRFLCRAQDALAAPGSLGKAISYEHVAPDNLEALFALAGHRPKPKELSEAQALFKRHSKNHGQEAFKDDSAAKQAAASAKLKRLFEKSLEEPYHALEKHRIDL